ncbi:MAG: hypothetical protein HY513_05275 [Candidatus Aenigmarchaeota archaeon]|nr:hypothetical protein [Candidatus Aenigmarchaeota archaeon]
MFEIKGPGFIEVGGRKVTRKILFASHNGRTASFPNYLQAGFDSLSLAAMVSAYYNDPDFRQSVRDHEGFGEYADAVLVDGTELVEEPGFEYDSIAGLWKLKDGKPRKVDLPEDGIFWHFDPKTGLPAKSGMEVQEEYGLLPPYFKREDRDMPSLSGVHTIIRFHGQYQPLVIDVTHELNQRVSHIGARMII